MFRDAQSARHGHIRNLDGTFTTVDAPLMQQIGKFTAPTLSALATW
jgi:hypothetical protein